MALREFLAPLVRQAAYAVKWLSGPLQFCQFPGAMRWPEHNRWSIPTF